MKKFVLIAVIAASFAGCKSSTTTSTEVTSDSTSVDTVKVDSVKVDTVVVKDSMK